MIVGLTGGIGSGKSTVARFFVDLGVPVYDSDKEAKKLMVDSLEIRTALVELLGSEAYVDKKLNKTFISSIVFNNPQMLDKLNAIVHPAVRKHFLQWAAEQNFSYVIQETALIFENEAQHNYDAIILVTTPERIRIQRVVARDGVAEEEVLARISNQISDSKKIKSSDYVIENHTFEKTKKSVQRIHKQLLDKSS